MNRVKVLVFALVAVGLWVAHLTMVSPALAAKAVEQASLPLLGAPAVVAQRLEAGRSELQAATLKLASDPVIWVKAGTKEAPTSERFGATRTAALAGLSEAAKATAYVLVANEQGALMALGSAEPQSPPEGFDVKAASSGGGEGVLLELNGTPYLFFSVPVVVGGGYEPKAAGAVALGAPLWGGYASVDALADAVARDLNLAGLGLWMKGQLVGASGKKDVLEKAFKAAKPGQTAVVEQGPVSSLGPLKLPMFTGSASALDVAARRDIPGTPFEVVAIGTVRPFMETLAASQKTSLLMVLGLLLAGIVFTLLVSGGGAREEEDEMAPARRTAPSPMPSEPRTRAEKVEPLPGNLAPMSEASASPEASPDDFAFPPAPEPHAAPTVQTPAALPPPPAFDGPLDDPFASAGPPPPLPGKMPPSLGLADDDDENQRTTAYPAHRPPPMMDPTTDSHSALDPFAMAGGAPDSSGHGAGGFNPDATRVAAIPPELIKASSRRDSGPTAQNPAFRPMSVAAPSVKPVGGGSDEDHHFQETFRDFLATRQKCGEPNDGMTYDKFAAKLRKNKEQLVTKYNCRTVKFQVYVKDGKAALKATPVKD